MVSEAQAPEAGALRVSGGALGGGRTSWEGAARTARTDAGGRGWWPAR